MLRHELQISHLRFYNNETTDPFEPFSAICTIVWESPGIIWIKGFHGNLTRRTLRDLLKFLLDNNIETVKAHRSIVKSLPGITVRDGNYIELSVTEIATRLSKFKKDSK